MQSGNVVERVIRQAMDTFYGASGGFEVRLDELTIALGELVASDFRLDARLLHSDVYQLNAVDDASPSSETAASPSSETAASPSSETVASPSSETAASPSSETAASPSSETAAGSSSETAVDPSSETAAGPSSETAAGPSSETAAGPSSETAAGPSSETAAGPSSETAAGPSSETAAGPSSATPARRRQTPVTYIDVYRSNRMTAGVYVLRDKARIPLHDHPNMHGLLKVLVGQVRVQSYNIKRSNYNRRRRFKLIDAEKLAPVVIGPGDLPYLLRPDHGNIHQVETVDGPAAIFDLLAPPYDTFTAEMGPRVCRFFKEINTRKGCKLIVVSHHKGYWTDSAPYDGPIVVPFAD